MQPTMSRSTHYRMLHLQVTASATSVEYGTNTRALGINKTLEDGPTQLVSHFLIGCFECFALPTGLLLFFETDLPTFACPIGFSLSFELTFLGITFTWACLIFGFCSFTSELPLMLVLMFEMLCKVCLEPVYALGAGFFSAFFAVTGLFFFRSLLLVCFSSSTLVALLEPASSAPVAAA